MHLLLNTTHHHHHYLIPNSHTKSYGPAEPTANQSLRNNYTKGNSHIFSQLQGADNIQQVQVRGLEDDKWIPFHYYIEGLFYSSTTWVVHIDREEKLSVCVQCSL